MRPARCNANKGSHASTEYSEQCCAEAGVLCTAAREEAAAPVRGAKECTESPPYRTPDDRAEEKTFKVTDTPNFDGSYVSQVERVGLSRSKAIHGDRVARYTDKPALEFVSANVGHDYSRTRLEIVRSLRSRQCRQRHRHDKEDRFHLALGGLLACAEHTMQADYVARGCCRAVGIVPTGQPQASLPAPLGPRTLA